MKEELNRKDKDNMERKAISFDSETSYDQGGIRPFMVVFAILLALFSGYLIGSYKPWHFSGNDTKPDLFSVTDSGIERYKVPIGLAPRLGPIDSKVTIVAFSDYQCPFCSKGEHVMQEVLKNYPKEVSVVFKHQPLSFHQMALPAARAASAIREQGEDKFWSFHKVLFENQDKLSDLYFEEVVKQVGGSVEKYKADLLQNQAKYDEKIQSDQAEARQFGAKGTPTFFVNGRLIAGAQPYENFKKVIEEEIPLANQVLRSGVRPVDLYEAITKHGKEQRAEKTNQPSQAPAKERNVNVVYKVPVGDAPVKGPKDAKVTIVVYSDFQCPFCTKLVKGLDQVASAYPKDVRIVFKQFPLPMHSSAHLAAEASLAAKAQGKFWQMHDKLFENQQHLDRASLESYAKELGLDLGKFRAALDQQTFKTKVDEELSEGSKFSVRGTPSMFINGKFVVGALSFEQFKPRIDQAIKEADELLQQKKIPPAAIYDEILKRADERQAALPVKEDADSGSKNDDALVKITEKVDPGKGPSVGPASAPVTIVLFSDFQCPFCSRVLPTIKQIQQKYGKQVRIFFRNYPLPMHRQAPLAAEASLSAHAQGKFWEMHDVLFQNQSSLDRASLEKYASSIGLDMARFKADLDTGKYKAAVQLDMKDANRMFGGQVGTPTFLVGNYKIEGAYPFETFDKAISQVLQESKKK